MIEPYYTAYQHKDWVKLQALGNVIGELHKQRNVFVNCGLTEPARKIWGQIEKTQRERDELAQKMVDDRKKLSVSMLQVFLIANLAYAKAMEFGELVQEISGEPDLTLSEDVKRLVKVSEELALSIDNAGNGKQVNAFSDIIDKLEERYNEVLMPEVEKIMQEFKSSLVFDKLF